ncbi:SURF1 family protein, partial [Novosphingobium sp. 2637]|nr:SURF1 family protein [Novosphingobium mangrovi (ex Hu et al. 2023)]
MRSIPIISTLVVLAAVGVMIALGVWQLERREEKAD